ncbi:helix-turn-helix domain-containing protein [Tsuneonella sp. CC-YZS046]|uniref:TetR/AcrR family transcriptional regulator n=1 Tax=Tsuneonella sp. CC-YZS046 TaxID=3042152 RepID=UPI002D79C038|nr:helix-turn-helix domain-containing protein [Tsuneonella sp. CC-YZS046]WRO66734.1 helix-turn-helix domain-containing protein [Tsuneonella sp. CC-YZS046]
MTAIAEILSRELDSRTRMILAAEVLFAREGIDGVSLRRIAASSGQKNHHAVQYHFGSRDGLVQAIFDYRMQQMDARRLEMIALAEQEQRLEHPRTIAEVIFLPQLALIDKFGDHSYANFLCQYLLRNSDAEYGRFGGNLPDGLRRTLNLLRQKLSFLSDSAAQRRLITACFMFLNLLAVYSRDLESGRATEDFENALEDTMRQIVAALFLPPTGG